MRITKTEIQENIEMFVNSIYDEKIYSGWMTATVDEWCEAVWEELAQWKSDGYGSSWTSNENRLDGKEATLPRIRKELAVRVKELCEQEHIQTTAYRQIFKK